MKVENIDIAEEMIKELKAQETLGNSPNVKLSKALQYLDKAAELLDNSKDYINSERITQIIEKLAKY